MDSILYILDSVFTHLKVVIVVILIAWGGYAISSYMTDKSVRYEPMNDWGSSIGSDISYNYSKSTSFSESFTVKSELEDAAGESSEDIADFNEINEAYSKLNDATGKSGTLVIPADASDLSVGGIDVYQWKKEYKIFFDLIPGDAVESIIVSDNVALKGKLEVSSGVLAEVTAYELEETSSF